MESRRLECKTVLSIRDGDQETSLEYEVYLTFSVGEIIELQISEELDRFRDGSYEVVGINRTDLDLGDIDNFNREYVLNRV